MQKETTTDANSLMNGLSESQASGEEEQQLRAVATDLESSSEHFTLEFSFDDVKVKLHFDRLCLDEKFTNDLTWNAQCEWREGR